MKFFPRRFSVLLALALFPLVLRPAALAADEAGLASKTEPISLDVNQAKIENVLRLIGRHYGLNVVAGREVTGTVTIRLQDVTCEEALDAVLRPNGFEYEKKGNLLEVRPITAPKPAAPAPPKPAPEPITRYIPLRYANGKDLVETLKALVPKNGGVFEYNERRNAFFVQAAPDDVDRFEKILAQVDKKVVQVRIEAKIVETLLSDADHLGIDWATSIKLTGASRPVTFPFVESIKGGAFFPLNNTEGVQTSVNSSTSSSTSRNASFFDSRSAFPLGQPVDFRLGHLDATEFSAVLQALNAQTDTKLVASPEVTALDNQQAKITIGSIIPIPTYTRNEERGLTTVSGYDKVETGTTLTVTPRVNDEKSITMILKPEVSDVTGYRGPLEEFPVIETRSAETVVVLEDGKTLVIAGLVRERTFTKTSKFPLLGDIPLLGYLFRYQGEDTEKTNLLIFITPHILDPEKMENEGRGMARLEGQWVPREAAERVTALRGALASPDHEARAAAAAALASPLSDVECTALRPAATLEALVRTDPSPEVRASALVALAGIDPDRAQALVADSSIVADPDAAGALALAALREPSSVLAWLDARAAARGNRADASRRFGDALRSPDAFVRTRAVRALVAIDDVPCEALAPLVSDPDPLVAAAALDALARSGASDFAEVLSARIAKLALGSPDPLVRCAARNVFFTVHSPIDGRRGALSFGMAPDVVSVSGEGPGPFKVRQALSWLAEKSPRHAHLVRLAISEISVVDGPTRVAADRLEISSRDVDAWPLASLSHQLVHFAAHAFRRRVDGPRPLLVEEALAFEEQCRAVNAIGGEPTPQRDALVEFVRKALRTLPPDVPPTLDSLENSR
ncbi:MAG: HEAT repeat domain-containing protein [Planctomycetes bacterium]|nr:HEAT repeat domain-containing protein [Planctomycetota bacterium]MBI3847969.1 HEAT repeat domain-containing protein [Planctomycetota bacterium]